VSTRTIFVGDVHGCANELHALLEQVKFSSGDRLVLVGDLIARGPDSRGVLRIARETGALMVRGNHEDRVLKIAEGKTSFLATPKAEHRTLAETLGAADLAMLRRAPLTLVFPEHNVRVLHAGLRPGVPFEMQEPLDLLTLRSVPDEAHQNVLWGARYTGPEHIVFGHHALAGLQLHPSATGLDTGCVYGKRLTALLLEENENVPRAFEARKERLVHVVAKRVYWSTGRAEHG
jgi:Calcineurin-like phosphoesterase